MLWSGAIPHRGGVRTDALENAKHRGAAVTEACQDRAWHRHPPHAIVLGARTLGCSRTSPCSPIQVQGLWGRWWSTVWAAVMVHREFPWQVLSCHLAQVLESVFSVVPAEGNAIRAIEDWAFLGMSSELTFSEVFLNLCCPCFSPCVANPLKVMRFLFCFSGYLINELTSLFLTKRAVIFPLESYTSHYFPPAEPCPAVTITLSKCSLKSTADKGDSTNCRGPLTSVHLWGNKSWIFSACCKTLKKKKKKRLFLIGLDPVGCWTHICTYGADCLHLDWH